MQKCRFFAHISLAVITAMLMYAPADAAYNALVQPGTPVSAYGCYKSVADNGPCINQAIAAVANGSAPAPVVIPDGLTFSTPISNPSIVPIVTVGSISFTGSGADAVVEGSLGTTHACASDVQSVINVTRSTILWTDLHAGVSLRNAYSCNFFISANGFYIGVDQTADTVSYYNNIFLGNMISDQIGVRRWAIGPESSVNQNTYYGGRFSTQRGGVSADIVGVLDQDDGASDDTINGNAMYNPDDEMVNNIGNTVFIKGATASSQPFVSGNNRVFGMRFEPQGTNNNCLFGGTGVKNNSVAMGFGYPEGGFSATLLCPTASTDLLTLQQNGVNGTGDFGQGASVFSTIPIVDRKNFVIRDSNGFLERGGYNIFVPLSGSNDFTNESSNFSLTTAAVTTTGSGNAVGRIFDLRGNNQDFLRLMRVEAQTSVAGGRLFVIAYDSSGTQLSSTADVGGGVFYSSGNVAWEGGSDLPLGYSEINLTFGPNVAFVFIGAGNGTANLSLLSLTVSYNEQAGYKPLADSSVMNILGGSGNFPLLPDGPYTIAIPAAPGSGNSYQSGEIVPNLLPTSGATTPSYWTYTGAGVWAAGPNIP